MVIPNLENILRAGLLGAYPTCFLILYLESGKEPEAVVYPGVVEAVVGALHAAKVDGVPAAENVAEMGGSVSSGSNSCASALG